jgi:Xaa-Pro aminopeptidase
MTARGLYDARPRFVLKNRRFSALLVTDRTNIRYLTGVAASAGLVLIVGSKIRLFVDGRYLHAAKKTAFPGIRVDSIECLPEKLKDFRRIGYESENVSVARLLNWKRKYKNTKFIHTQGLIENLRRVKRPGEIRKILGACRITRKILELIPGILKPGITELETALKITSLALGFGADGMAFDSIVAFGENTASPHHHPGARAFRSGDIVQIDIGARFQGYCSDFSRVFFTAKKTDEQKEVYAALIRAKRAAEVLLRPGIGNRALDLAARKVLKQKGYDRQFCHSLGHGLGLSVHEQPTLSKKARLIRIKKNEVITIEPGVYFDGKWGMRIEDTIIVR